MRSFPVLALALALACDRPSKPDPHPPITGPVRGDQGHEGGDEVDGADPPPAGDEEGGAVRPSPPGGRVPAVAEDHALFARVEGEGFDNACEADADCKIGGCSGEVCSADASVVTTCDALPMKFPDDAACGCVQEVCRWWSPSGKQISGGPVGTEPPATKSGDAPDAKLVECGEQTCKPGQECVEYYGVAGTRGPKLRSCEWRCTGGCPTGTQCVTIADGPGRVCR